MTVKIPVDELLSLIERLDKKGRPRYNERVWTPVPLEPELEFSFWSDGYDWYLEVQDNA